MASGSLYQPALYRILDANLDRVREGLRILEEWCRFGLDHRELTEECKALRQETAMWHHNALRSARNTATDPGTSLTHPQEEQRANVQQVLQANFCRVEEAMRVLEEYGKLYDRAMGLSFKQMRYRVYQLESQILAHERYQKLLRSRLYLVTSPSDTLEATLEAALQGGLTLVQYRAKTEGDQERLAQGQRLRELCHRYGALFVVNDRVDVALAVNADGVHLGQQDIPIALARQILGPDRLVGRSTTNPEELQQALAEGADYVGVGPVYETPTKPGKAAAGLDYVRHAQAHCPIPWFAIGSVNANNLRDVLEAGAQRVAVVRAIMDADQPTLVTQYFLSQLQRSS